MRSRLSSFILSMLPILAVVGPARAEIDKPIYPYFEEIFPLREMRTPLAQDAHVDSVVRELAESEYGSNWFIKNQQRARRNLSLLEPAVGYVLLKDTDDFLNDLTQFLIGPVPKAEDLLNNSSSPVKPPRFYSAYLAPRIKELQDILSGLTRLGEEQKKNRIQMEREAYLRKMLGEMKPGAPLDADAMELLKQEITLYFYHAALYSALGPGTSWSPYVLGHMLCSGFTVTYLINNLGIDKIRRDEVLRAVFYVNPVSMIPNDKIKENYRVARHMFNSAEFHKLDEIMRERISLYEKWVRDTNAFLYGIQHSELMKELDRAVANLSTIEDELAQAKTDQQIIDEAPKKRHWWGALAGAVVGGVICLVASPGVLAG